MMTIIAVAALAVAVLVLWLIVASRGKGVAPVAPPADTTSLLEEARKQADIIRKEAELKAKEALLSHGKKPNA